MHKYTFDFFRPQLRLNAEKQDIGIVRVCAKIYLSKLVLIVVFQLWRVFSSCGSRLFLSFFEAEVFPDLVLLFLLSSACHCLLLIKEMTHSFVKLFFVFVQLSQ